MKADAIERRQIAKIATRGCDTFNECNQFILFGWAAVVLLAKKTGNRSSELDRHFVCFECNRMPFQ